ncbi:MAG: enoyl-CoA hydratase/isomerase family protein [Pseudomonadales bacterium]
MSDEQPVIVETHSGWAEIVLNRPERRNSLIAPLASAITDALTRLAADPEIAAVILRGAEGYFCAGVDLKALQADPPPPWRDTQGAEFRRMHLAFYHFPKPIIGAFEGFGINAGAALALACDVLVAGTSAFLQIGELHQGSPIPMNAAWLRIKTTELVAARLAFYADRIKGDELVRLGLAAESVPDDQVLARCRELAERIAGFPAGASVTIKQNLIDQRHIEDPETFFVMRQSNALLTAAQVRS